MWNVQIAIAIHADMCVDVWVGDVQSAEEDSEKEEEPETPTDNDKLDIDQGINIKEIISNLVEQNVKKIDPRRINVRRKSLWADFKDARKRWNLKPSDPIRIVFLGEPAIDDGGPKREFFSEMLEYIERKLFYLGKPINSTVALQHEDFLVAGEVMVFSILQGGPAPSFLHPCIYKFLTKQPLPPEDNESCYKTAALKIKEAKDDQSLRDVLLSDNVLDLLNDKGYTGVPHRETLSTTLNIVQSLCIKSQLASFMPQLMQLEQGMKNCSFLSSMRTHPDVFENIFISGKSFTLTGGDVYKYFCDFLQTIDQTTVCELIKWISGVSTIPVLGFNKKFSVSFVHGCSTACKCRPTTSTCDLSLKLPVHINSEDEMKEMMMSAIKDCYGFGLV